MLTKTIDCVDCGQSVAYGRLSCPECGALLASVAGAVRSPRAVVRAMPVEMIESAGVDDDAPIAESAQPIEATEPVEDELTRPEPAASIASAEPIEIAEPAEPLAAAAPEPEVTPPEPAAPAESASAAAEAVTEPELERGSLPVPKPSLAPWTGVADTAPMLSPRPYRHFVESGSPDPPPRPPSVYRPPNLTLDSEDAIGSGDIAVVAAPGAGLNLPTPPGTQGGIAPSAAAEPGIFDAERFAEIAGWFVVVGAAMSVLGFLLPWSRVVIGAASTGGYLDSWGLASPTHALVFLALLAVLGIGVMRAPIAPWIWAGVAGLILGSLVIGLAWPYLVGRLGADVGVLIAALGGLALVVGGVVTSWATRHASVDSPV